MKRRDLFRLSTSIPLSLFLPSVGTNAAVVESTGLFLIDDRHLDLLPTELSAQRNGWNVRTFSGDITPLWFNELTHTWRDSAAGVTAGLTSANVLFCLAQMARDAQLAVLEKQLVTVQADEPLYYWIIGPTGLQGDAAPT